MADPKGGLPEGTDKIINGTMETRPTVGLTPDELSGSGAVGATDADAGFTGATDAGTGTGTGSSGRGGSLMERVRGGGGKLSTQAADKARGLVGQGLERSAEALANVGRLVGETAEGLEERLGEEFGDYARRAAGAIEGTANNLAAKDPDELIDDTRRFIRKSPGVALAGAAIAGFAIARLIKSGLSADEDDGEGGGGKRKRS
jgi:hypothetical protein